MDFSYLYPYQVERFIKHWKCRLLFRSDIKKVTIDNGYVFPMKKTTGYWGTGCITTSDGQPVPESFLHGIEKPKMSGKYECDKNDILFRSGTFLYLGPFTNHWGHFIVDSTTRLYALKQFPDAIPFFMAFNHYKSLMMHDNIKRFFELLGIDYRCIQFIFKPCSMEKIIIPEQSYREGKFFSNEYLDVFIQVAENIQPTVKDAPANIFLSRKSFLKDENREIGLDLLDTFLLMQAIKLSLWKMKYWIIRFFILEMQKKLQQKQVHLSII